ncbi:peptide-methionine (S)-S-oxide reductase MsrA [Chitinophaga sp. XS-30]|uniref:peptide-methionine (S)-S-oxide reductase MsrA n=1 Tax=Chitinophaga sp. XS-30 TaxID=2604421 RepID=UPI00143DF48A
MIHLKKHLLSACLLVTSLASCAQPSKKTEKVPEDMTIDKDMTTAVATFGTGCFWCTEAQFQQLEGVLRVESGYSGGSKPNPTYEEVSTGLSGHAEVVQITYDPAKISFETLLEAFWQAHDPTTLNRQGNDVGPQYRSVIFYHDEEQQRLAELYKKKLNEEKVYDDPIVTEISPYKAFYVAENYHQDYYNLNGSQPYCTYVIKPKLEKFKKVFKDKLKK